MEKEKVDRISGLGALQIAALAIGGSTIVALATLAALKRLGLVRGAPASEPDILPQPAVPTRSQTEVPHHFTEDVVVPGHTYTGADILAQDERAGRSPEGV